MLVRVHVRGTLVGAALRRACTTRGPSDPLPRLLAAGDGGVVGRESPLGRDGQYDTARLTAVLAEPLARSPRPLTRPIWRCTLELDATERRLTSTQWGDAVRAVLDGAGVTRRDGPDVTRWVAVAHGDSRVEIVAALAGEDGQAAPVRLDRVDRSGVACGTTHHHERAGPVLAPCASAIGRGADAPPVRPLGARSGRDRLRQHVRAAAIVAADEDDFFVRLRAAGLRVRRRVPGRTDPGYAVSLPVTISDAARVWLGGAQLAADLSLPRLRVRWAYTGRIPDPIRPATGWRRNTWQRTTEAVGAAASALVDETVTLDPEVAHAVADVLTAAAPAVAPEQPQRLTDAAELLRDAVGNRRRPAATEGDAVHLQRLARLIGLADPSGDPPGAGTSPLLQVMIRFADNLAERRSAQHRRTHAAAARCAAAHLRAASHASGHHPRREHLRSTQERSDSLAPVTDGATSSAADHLVRAR